MNISQGEKIKNLRNGIAVGAIVAGFYRQQINDAISGTAVHKSFRQLHTFSDVSRFYP